MEVGFVFIFKKDSEAEQYAKEHQYSLVTSGKYTEKITDPIPIIYGVSVGCAIIEIVTTCNLRLIVFEIRNLENAVASTEDPIIIGIFGLFNTEQARKCIRDHAPCNFKTTKRG